MQKKWLVADLDGTLLNLDGSIPHNLDKFLKFLKSKNIDFIVATSRAPQNVHNLFKDHLNYISICSDGAITTLNRKNEYYILNEMLMDKINIKYAVSILKQKQMVSEVYLFLGSKNNFSVYTTNSNMDRREDHYVFIDNFTENRAVIYEKNEFPDERLLKSVRAISFFGKTKKLKIYFDLILNLLPKEKFQTIFYAEVRMENFSWIDIINVGVNKGSALKRLIEKEDYSPYLITIGNGSNDESMIVQSDVSLCPKNSTERVKELVNYKFSVACGHEFITKVQKQIMEMKLDLKTA